MKKTAVLTLLAVFAGVSAYAAEPVGMDAQRAAHREEMKKIKQAQRADRKSGQSTPAEPSKMDKFWKNEGERSGLSQSGNGIGSFLKSLNPGPFLQHQQEEYNTRKAAGAK